MSKQSKAKEDQGYNPKPTFPMCSNCEHYHSIFIANKYQYTEEKDIRCGLGGFAIKKQGTCKEHKSKHQ